MPEQAVIDLRPDGRLRLNEGACLPLRSAFGGCRACAEVCPVGAISVDVQRVTVGETCIACGRCAAVCPNEALTAAGLQALQAATRATTQANIRLECVRVPSNMDRPGTVRVPCLGAISVGWLATLQAHAGDREVHVIDRGWCSQCIAGGADHPARRAIAAVAVWLTGLEGGEATPPVPRLREEPLPLTLARPFEPPTPSANDPAPISRREFLRALARSPAAPNRRPTPIGSDGHAAFPPSARRPSPERTRLLAALDQTAQRTGAEVPAEFFPRLNATGTCVDHRVCVAACPTGALTVEENDGSAALRFAGETCIACGACTRACPEGALRLDEHGGARQAAVLVRHELRACSHCGERFAPRADEPLCAACAKAQRFIDDAMTQLFGTRH